MTARGGRGAGPDGVGPGQARPAPRGSAPARRAGGFAEHPGLGGREARLGGARLELSAFSPEVLARADGENFPVALRLLPRELRRDLLALYGFARLADTLGDEAEGDREALLDALETELDLAFEGRATHPLLRRLEPTLRSHSLPARPFRRLVEANRRDQRVQRYPSFAELRGYCALSATVCPSPPPQPSGSTLRCCR